MGKMLAVFSLAVLLIHFPVRDGEKGRHGTAPMRRQWGQAD